MRSTDVQAPSTRRLDAIGRALDHLLSVDLTARGVADALFEAARRQAAAAGDRSTAPPPSLVRTVALAVVGRLAASEPGARVLLLTGFPSRSWLLEGLTETDGPVGAAVLARVLEEALGAVPVLLTEARLVPYVAASVRAAGLITGSLEQALASKPGPPAAAVAAVVPFASAAGGDAPSAARELLARVRPAAAIAVEMPGKAADGRYYNVSGREVPPHLVADGDALFQEARRRGVLTVGIGDGGNELGMGNIADAVESLLPEGRRVAARTPVDFCIAASISNTGAFALAAALAAEAGRPEVLDAIDVGRIIERCSDAGAVDGVSSRVDPMSDGVPVSLNRALWDLMRFAVRSGLRGWVKQ